VQTFGYDEAIHRLEAFDTAESCLEFLAIPEDPSLPKVSKWKPKKKPKKFSFDNFVQTANVMTQSMRQLREYLLSLQLAFLADL
jgi:hypothetical protein